MTESSAQVPKVSVICLCFNQASFINKSLQSVLDQTYANVEVIIVNDASTDHSSMIIHDFLKKHPEILFLNLTENIGNCKAFNLGLKRATGKYIIDLSCDDILIADRITKQVAAFESLPPEYGVIYSDAIYIDQNGKSLGSHFEQYSPIRGEVYGDLVARYFIAPPTMMMKKAVFDELEGYDELLAYEDFDFWVRSSRNWKYDYVNDALTQIRKSRGSLSSKFHERDSPLHASTVVVCEKIKTMNRTEQEDQALVQRLRYELKMAGVTGSQRSANDFYELYHSITSPDLQSRLWLLFSFLRWNAFPLIRLFQTKATS